MTVTGPMLLLELCNTTLKEWLNDNSSLTVAMLDDMLLFALNIASGVEFLHSKRVTCTLQLYCRPRYDLILLTLLVTCITVNSVLIFVSFCSRQDRLSSTARTFH